MAINKKIRIKVWQKYNGHCAYCGKEIAYKEMQVDHKHPKNLNSVLATGRNLDGTLIMPNPDRFENLMPSCRRCNHYKRGHELNYYRGMIDTIHERIRASNYIIKVAEDYGLMEFKEFGGLFYFETITKQP